jgi:hypothetical protein
MIKRVLLYVVVMFILLAVALSAGQQDDTDALLQQYSEEISSWLTAQEAAAVANTARSDIQNIPAYTLITHQGDSILRYSNTAALPSPRNLKRLSATPGRNLVQLPLGWFFAKVETQGLESRTTLIPIRYTLNLDDPGKGAAFPANKKISSNLHVSAQKTAYPILVGGAELCWLQADGPIQTGWLSWLKLGAWALFFITFFSLLNQVATGVLLRFPGWHYFWRSSAGYCISTCKQTGRTHNLALIHFLNRFLMEPHS